MLRCSLAVLATVLIPVTAPVAAQAATAQALLDALRLDDMVALMQREGLDYGADLGTEMMPGRDTAEWEREVARVYDLDVMVDGMSAAFLREMEGVDVTPLEAFFTSDLGTEIVTLEYTAREAFLDESVEEAAIARVVTMEEAGDARLEQVKDFVAANDYIETNVVGALNANYAFYIGMIDGGGINMGLTDDQVLSMVWEQEPEIRENTTEWLYSYLYMAYQPLEDAELAEYQALLQTDAGRAMNRALFAGFDQMYVAISRQLGISVSRFSGGEEL
ncbi:hypothetical protein [Nereida sp. MMG025]|uniref:hypothetical protein n=1 Tax=Nereida sp. MMG025 TaxID=2909981 RepID=UPI001F4854B9|nr:hypothetical protein [Nereida sp. MMG025]MCF6443414.1 hypothetical protein [Nereida sp. MMG025]